MTNNKNDWRDVFRRFYSRKSEWHPDATALNVEAFIEKTRKDAVEEALEEAEKEMVDKRQFARASHQNVWTAAIAIIRQQKDSL